MFFENELSEDALQRMYETVNRNHTTLLESLKSIVCEEKQKDAMKELQLVNGLMMNVIKLVNHKKKMKLKINL
jgi:hypothetical protein